MRIAIFDPSAGVSGDMTLGALLSLGVPASWLEQLPAPLGLAGVGVTIRDTRRCGVAAEQAEFSIPLQPHGPRVRGPARLARGRPIARWGKPGAPPGGPAVGATGG